MKKRMSFMEHLAELRGRLRISVIVFVLVFFISYVFSDRILLFLWDHFLGQFDLEPYQLALLANSVMSGFVTQLNLSLIVAAATTIPVFIYEMFLFIEPALDRKHRLMAAKIVLSATVLFIIGAAFVYYIMLPMLLGFFIQSNVNLGVSNFFSVELFFEFIMINMFLGGVVFQTPLIIILANQVGILPREFLANSRRFVYIAILIFAGIITPDHSIVSQLILSAAMLILFEMGLLFTK
jgi:sec-independent protein translocase protein TatC